MSRARSAYWKEFQRAAIDTRLAREVQGFEVIEALALIQIPVQWKGKVTRSGQVIWREYFGVAEYTPGQVLHPEWRAATEWENEAWQNLSDDQLQELGVFTQDGAFSSQIVEKIKDLTAAIRQRGRHIPDSEIFRRRRRFVLAGHAQLLSQYASQLNRLIQSFLEAPRPSAQVMEQGADELSQIYLDFERRRTVLMGHAKREIQSALQGEYWEVQSHTAQAVAHILAARVRDYEMAIRTLDLAFKLRILMADIERRFRNAYNRLGQLGQELQGLMSPGQAVPPMDLLRIANEASGIWRHLEEQVPKFNPYYERLQEPEFQRLSRVLSHAEAGRDSTVFNFIEGAAAKLEAVAIGERPTRAELTKERQTLF